MVPSRAVQARPVTPLEWGLLAAVAAALVWSGIAPRDRFTWWLEVAPVLVGLPIVIAVRPRFRLSPLVEVVLALHALVLVVGGHYTYAEVPAGFWARDALGLARNHYDRFGHLMQGFSPALLAREVLVRRSPLHGSRWLPVLVLCVCLAVSAAYELVEWWAALLTGSRADAFLGTQGDPWDTQWDMALAGAGAIVALVALSRLHDRMLRRTCAAG